jgi:hypothetical protein
MIADIASGHISMEYAYHGPNFGVVSACASSNNAIIDAFNLIRLGKADVMVPKLPYIPQVWVVSTRCMRFQPVMIRPKQLRVPSARAATDSLSAKVR